LPYAVTSFIAIKFLSGLLRRLAEFRAVNTEDETVLNYFDELEIHPDHIGMTNNSVRWPLFSV
jgi:hypothetical protein